MIFRPDPWPKSCIIGTCVSASDGAMEIVAAAREVPERLNVPRTSTGSGRSLLLIENGRAIGGAPSLVQALTPAERETLVASGRRRVLYRGQTLFSQGARNDGIF